MLADGREPEDVFIVDDLGILRGIDITVSCKRRRLEAEKEAADHAEGEDAEGEDAENSDEDDLGFRLRACIRPEEEAPSSSSAKRRKL